MLSPGALDGASHGLVQVVEGLCPGTNTPGSSRSTASQGPPRRASFLISTMGRVELQAGLPGLALKNSLPLRS